LTGFLEASVPGEYKYRRKGEILRCPWHGWEFDVKSGQSWWNPTQKRVRKYKVRLESGSEIQEEVKEVKAAATGLQKGPYTAETYDVSIEKQYVVVEIIA
jgi:3-phenylpropionate/trans-cinnamate dioxygenase ferredoxin subunit